MDLGPSILISSVTGALLFFSGGRFWGKASARREATETATRGSGEDHAARARAEEEASAARTQAEAERGRAEAEAHAARTAHAARARAEQEAHAAHAARAQSSHQLDAEAVRVTALSQQVSRAAEAQARLEAENAALRREVEERRRAEGRFADVQRQSVELATKAHALDRRRIEIEAKEAELGVLRGEVHRLSVQAAEVEELRRQVRDLTSRGFAFQATSVGPTLGHAQPRSGQKLAEAIEEQLEALRRRRGSCQSAVIADSRGLLLASAGDAMHQDALAAATSLATEAGDRLRPLLPLGEPLEIRLTDVNRVVFTARWLRGEDTFHLGTLGVVKERADPRAEAIETAISDLLRPPERSA